MPSHSAMSGVLYTATGSTYVEQALVSIRSLRRWNHDLPVAVFTDDPTPFRNVADHVEAIPQPPEAREQRMLPRLLSLQLSPFARTLAMDTDTVVMGPLDELFEVLQRVSVGICHGHQRARRFRTALMEGKALAEIPYSFAPVQGGVILYDDVHGMEFVTDVAALYKQKNYIDDQVSMREVLWNASYRFATLGPEYNIWELNTLDRWAKSGFETAFPKIFHTVTLKKMLSPNDIDRLLLPIANRAAEAQAVLWSKAAHVADPLDASIATRAHHRLRSQARAWRSERRLKRRLKASG